MAEDRREQLKQFVEREFIGPDPVNWDGLLQENGESWKQKYDAEHQKCLAAFHEIQELKRQLKSLYSSEQVVQATQ